MQHSLRKKEKESHSLFAENAKLFVFQLTTSFLISRLASWPTTLNAMFPI